MQPIKRTVYFSVCNGERIDEHGEYVDFSETIEGDFSPVRATSVLQRRHADKTIRVNNTESIAKVYVLSPENFMKYAELAE